MSNSEPKIVVSDKDLRVRLEHMRQAAADWTPVTKPLSHKLRNSVDENFAAGGRYDRAGSITGGTKKWEARQDGSPSFLQESGVLRGSIMPEHTTDDATVSTNMEYAAENNFGRVLGERSSLMTKRRKQAGGKPARPFMVVQAQEVEEAKRLGRRHILGRGA